MQVLIILVIFQITPWVIFQKYNCGHNEERQVCLLLTLIAQGFELSLGGGLHKKTDFGNAFIDWKVTEPTAIHIFSSGLRSFMFCILN